MELSKCFEMAKLGRTYWENFEEKNDAERYILLPHECDEYNIYAAEYLEKYMTKEKAESVVVISSCQEDLDRFDDDLNYDITKCHVEQMWIECVLKYYALYQFSKELIVVSLTKPYNTSGENLLGVHNITKRELLCYDIYGLESI